MAFTQEQMTSIDQLIARAIHPLEQELYRTQHRQLIHGSKYNVMVYKCQLLEDRNTHLKEALVHQSNEQLLLSNELQALKEKTAALHPSPVTPTKKVGEWDNPWGTQSKWRNRPLPDEKQDTKPDSTASQPSPVSSNKQSTSYEWFNPHGTPKQATSYPSPPVTPTKELDTPSKHSDSTTSNAGDDVLMQGSRLDGKHSLDQRDDKCNEFSALPSYGLSSPNAMSSAFSNSKPSSIVAPENETMEGCPSDGSNGTEQRDNGSDDLNMEDAAELPPQQHATLFQQNNTDQQVSPHPPQRDNKSDDANEDMIDAAELPSLQYAAAPQQDNTNQQAASPPQQAAPLPQQFAAPAQQPNTYQQLASPPQQLASAPQSTQLSQPVAKGLKRKNGPHVGDADDVAAPKAVKKIKPLPLPQKCAPMPSSRSSVGTKEPEIGNWTQKLAPMPSRRPSVTVAAPVTLPRSDTPARAPFGSSSSFPFALRPGSDEKRQSSIKAAKPATESAEVASAPLTNEAASVPSVPSPMPSASDSPMAFSNQDASMVPVTPVASTAPVTPPQSAAASDVAESPYSSMEDTNQMIERITAGMDGLVAIIGVGEAESRLGVEHNTGEKKEKKRGYSSIMQAKYEKLARNLEPSQSLDEQHVDENNDHLTGHEQPSSHHAASQMQDGNSHAEEANAQPSHGLNRIKGQPVIPDEQVFLTPYQQHRYDNECAIRQELN
jgi:hypothetical protein